MHVTNNSQPRCFSLILMACCSSSLWAECSDSGFCRMPTSNSRTSGTSPANDHLPASTSRVGLSAGWSVGLRAGSAKGDAKEGPTYSGVSALGNWQPRASTVLSVEVPWARASGGLGSTSGLGDILVAADQRLAQTSMGSWSCSIGVRLPTGDDQALSGAGLGYQPGLGSTDVILAAGWKLQGFDARVGYIAALGRNGTPGIELERGDDVAVAAGYTVTLNPLDIRGGLQGTHRLQNSTAINGSGGRADINDSAGTQVNLQLGATWQADEHWNLGLDAAIALIERQENAAIDGLTRSRSIALQALFSW